MALDGTKLSVETSIPWTAGGCARCAGTFICIYSSFMSRYCGPDPSVLKSIKRVEWCSVSGVPGPGSVAANNYQLPPFSFPAVERFRSSEHLMIADPGPRPHPIPSPTPDPAPTHHPAASRKKGSLGGGLACNSIFYLVGCFGPHKNIYQNYKSIIYWSASPW